MAQTEKRHPRPGTVAAIILTCNEEPNLPQALDSLRGWADEVFVFDSFSSDRTVEIARGFGAQVRQHLYNSATIYMPWKLTTGDQASIGKWALIYNLGRITVGSRTNISQRAHFCAGTHAFTEPALPLLKPPIVIKDQAWICADAFVGPGVTIGEGAIVGARAVVVKDVEPWHIVAGNPARFLRKRIMKETHAD